MIKKGIMIGIAIVSMIALMAIPMVNASSIDIHELNAQIYSNLSVPGVAPGFISEQYPSGHLPQNNYIVARSPGSSNLTVSVNNTLVYNNYLFTDIVVLPLVLNVSPDVPLIITIHSNTMNYTRIVYYRAVVLSNTQYITYLETINHKITVPQYTASNIVIGFAYAIAGVVISILLTVWGLWQSRSNPNIEKGLKGGTK